MFILIGSYYIVPDADGDGVGDPEDAFPNDPNEWADTDDDGIGDNGDACPADPANDVDSDGVCGDVDNCANTANADQANYDGDAEGDACDTDDDNDGLLDSVETNTGSYVSQGDTGTDPLNADSDGDGLDDGVETNTGSYVSPSDTGSDPNNADSDGDSTPDGEEVTAGSDPNDAGSPASGLPALSPLSFLVLAGLLVGLGVRRRLRA